MQISERTYQIALVEDDGALRTLLTRYLRQSGFPVRGYATAAEFRASADQFDLVILDVMLPATSGLDLCRWLRERSKVPIIFISARSSHTDRIVGLEIGGDDYITKPFSPRELVSRVRAVLRRVQGSRDTVEAGASPRLVAGDIEIDIVAREARRGGEVVSLTSREFELLAFLMRNPNRAFRREELLEKVWGYTVGDTSTVTVHVRRLREKIEIDPGEPRHLATVWGVGYRFEP